MSDLVSRYLKDYSKNYLVFNGLPTSPYGTTLAKRCKWCYSVMYPKIPEKNIKNNKEYIKPSRKNSVMKQAFCSKDCQEDYRDWSYFKRLRYQRERQYKLNHPSSPSIASRKRAMERKTYFHKYFLENRDKKRQQANEAMRRYRAKKQVNS